MKNQCTCAITDEIFVVLQVFKIKFWKGNMEFCQVVWQLLLEGLSRHFDRSTHGGSRP